MDIAAAQLNIDVVKLRAYVHRYRQTEPDIFPARHRRLRPHGKTIQGMATRDRIRALLITFPGINQKEIQRKTDLSRQTISLHVNAIRKEWKKPSW